MNYFSEFIMTLGLVDVKDVSLQDGDGKYIYNTEQLTRKYWRDLINNRNKIIIDYSEENMKFIKNKKLFLPILYQPTLIFEKQQKIYDVSFIGTMTPRRLTIVCILIKLGFVVKIIDDFDLEKKNIEILKSKVLINIHAFNDYNVFEYSRCSIPVFNSQVVVSETSLDKFHNINTINDYVLSKVIFVDYKNIINKVVEVLDNFNSYRYESDLQVLKYLTHNHICNFNLFINK